MVLINGISTPTLSERVFLDRTRLEKMDEKRFVEEITWAAIANTSSKLIGNEQYVNQR